MLPLMLKIIFVIMVLFSHVSVAYSDTLYLKSGKKLEGKIIEETDKYIKIDFNGIILTYWLDEIEKVETGESERAVSGQREDAELFFKKGTRYLNEGKWQQAIAEFKNAIFVERNHVGAHFNLGCAYALVGEYNKGIEEFEKALTLESPPFNAFCYFNIAGVDVKEAMLKKDAKLFEKAKENFARAAQILPNFILAMDYAMHSNMLANLETLKTFHAVTFSVSENGIPPDSVVFLAAEKIIGSEEEKTCLFDANGPPLLYFFRSPACRHLECVAKLDLQNPSYLSQEAQACFNAVLNLLDNELKSRANQLIKWNILTIFSNFYIKEGNWEKVIEFSEKAKEVGLNYSVEYMNLALAYFQKGDYTKANASAKKALEINPDATPEIRSVLGEIIKKTETDR